MSTFILIKKELTSFNNHIKVDFNINSTCLHLAHIAANALMLLSMMSKKQFDNRDKKS